MAATGESLWDEADGEPTDDALPRARAAPRTGAFVDDASPEDESAPVDPAEPVVSAAANGIDAIADPTPRATASAPTRPTYRA